MDSTGNITTWDCVYFGHYWQSDTNGDGKADRNDAKEPIKWRVLSVNGDDAFLLADQNLDCQKYNNKDVSVTWETCTIRSWLNGYDADTNKCNEDYTEDNFIGNAFTADEQTAIREMTVVNVDNPEYDTEGGKNTTDKVFLLSLDEVQNPSYGFISSISNTKKRESLNTAYAKSQGAYTPKYSVDAKGGYWWLRSPGRIRNDASCVRHDGGFSWEGSYVNDASNAVRPALHLNLSLESVWSHADSVTSEEKNTSPESSPSATPTVKPSASPTVQPSATPTVQPSATPTAQPGESPTAQPGESPIVQPGESPIVQPSGSPIVQPGESPTAQPGELPTVHPGEAPAVEPGEEPATGSKPAQVTGLKGKGKKKAVQASWKKAAGAKGYQIQYGTSKKWKKKKAKTTKKTKLTLGKLKSKKTYYIRVRAYTVQNGKKVYGRWSKTVKKKVK